MPDPTIRLLRRAAQLPARAVLGLIWLYRKTLSPALPVVFGPGGGCRFAPTCSHYAAEAVRTHGALAGLALTARRLAKCGPWHPGGPDPVPPRKPTCRTAAPLSSLATRHPSLS
jgi:hypothetical protein